MLRLYTPSILTLVTLLTPELSHAQRERGGAGYGWLSDYRSGLEQAKKTGKPLMVVLRCVP